MCVDPKNNDIIRITSTYHHAHSNGIILRITCVAISRHQYHAPSNGNILRIMCVALLLCVVENVCFPNVVENGLFPVLKFCLCCEHVCC